MRVTIYDTKPGAGLAQSFLKLSWAVGCWLQKLFGQVDAYYGAESWDAAVSWLEAQPGPLTSVQYWGHGSPGAVWLAQKMMPPGALLPIKSKLAPGAVIWFRCCSVFQGKRGFDFAKVFSDGMGCTIAAHTYVIGLWQSGLHTHKPGAHISWPVDEGIKPLKAPWWPEFLRPWLPNTVFCLRTRIPEGW